MTKKKKQTLRQQMREKANSRLEELLDEASNALIFVCGGDTIDHLDLAKMMAGGQTKTLREKLVTQLTNRAEEDLLAFFNGQNELELGGNDEKSSDS